LVDSAAEAAVVSAGLAAAAAAVAVLGDLGRLVVGGSWMVVRGWWLDDLLLE
jgi:hypothetical protein